MKSIRLRLLALGLTAFAIGSPAFAQELLTEVKGSEEATVRAENEYFLKKHLYFAGRHRVVKVNADLLLSGERLQISLFDNEVLDLKVSEVQTDDQKYNIHWRGEMANPSIDRQSLVERGYSREKADLIYGNVFSVTITAARYEFDEASKTSVPSHLVDNILDGKSRNKEAHFYEVLANIKMPTLENEYSLVSLEMDRRYHVLIEIDQSKTFPQGGFDDAENPELGEKRRAYRDFIDSLGEDPRKAAIVKVEAQ